MPDPPPAKRSPVATAPRLAEDAGPAYAELHCKTNYSFLEGASHPDELVARAAELGYCALAVTDRNSLSGVVRADAAAKALGFKLLIGAEITPADANPVALLATDRQAYARLSRLITLGRRRAPKGECHLNLDDLAAHAEGLLALVCPAPDHSPQTPHFVRRRHSESGGYCEQLAQYREVFGDRCHALAELHRGLDDVRCLESLQSAARQAGVPLVASGNVHYHHPHRSALHDVLTATRHGCTVAEAGRRRFTNAQRHLRPRDEIAALFAAAPEALRRAVEVADRCHFSLDELRYEYPEELCPPGVAPREHLAALTWQGAGRRYPQGVPEKVRRLIEHELALIAELRYEAYFLTVWDLVRFARGRGILCQGRGSAANSAVCYCLGVTAVDPERMDVLFERFVSREREEAPDIDVDFEHERREEVLQYLYQKYGRERAGMTAEVITYRPRSAVRDVGKALGLSLETVDRIAKLLDGHGPEARFQQRLQEAGLDPDSPVGRRLTYLVGQLIGFPRHLSQHVGGMVITRGPLCELVPIENAAMPERTVVQWDKDDLDTLGILKVDCLALGMLTAIRKCFQLIETHWGRKLTLASVPAEDPAVYEMVSRADTLGVFQIESRAQMSMLPRLKPKCFYDLVIEVAIVRPGPIQGDMVHPYLRRRAGIEPVEYPSEALREVLEKTLGVPLFQEQAMRLAVVAAGFTPGEADQLRRAMGAWRRPGVIDQFRRKLIEGMLAQGLQRRFAERVFDQIRGFGEYGFPESHAASFALLVYVSAWLKRHYPAAFTAALLNSQPLGFYAPAQLIRDAQQHGVEALACDVNFSGWDTRLEPRQSEDASPPAPEEPPLALRLGLRLIVGLPKSQACQIEAARGEGPFASFADFTRRAGLRRAALERLARADVFASLGLNRRAALWRALGHENIALPLFTGDDDEAPFEPPPAPDEEETLADYQTQGLSLRAHPMSFVRERLDALGVLPAENLQTAPHGSQVRVAGIVLVRQRPSTARGITFFTLEDETGQANLVVRPAIWEKHHRAARGAAVLLAHGRLERMEGVIHVVTSKLEDIAASLSALRNQSRDFR